MNLPLGLTTSLTFGPLALFGLVGAISPGPNNLLLMRSGAAFGVRRTVPQILGIEIGFVILMIACWLGVGALVLAAPSVMIALRWLCFAYLLWLAWLILRDSGSGAARAAPASRARPMSIVESTIFQAINPKAWMLAMASVSGFTAGVAPTVTDITLATLLLILVGTPCMFIWAAWGALLERALQTPRAKRVFGVSMSALVVLSALWMLRA